ncbi:MAG: helix-turn-helix domain-containing protein [Bergeyella sp.]
MKKALRVADSLYAASSEPYFKIKSLMLSATLLQETGDAKKAVDYALRAEKIAANSDDRIQNAEIYGFLASQYRSLNLYNQSSEYIQKATEQATQIDNPKVRNNILGLITQENANYHIDLKNYKKAVLLLEKSDAYFKENETANGIFLATNQQLLGDCYYQLKAYDKALTHYQNGLERIKSFPDNFVRGFIYNGMAAVYIKKENPAEAKKYIDLSQKTAEATQYLKLKKEIYKTSQEYYILSKNLEKLTQMKTKEEAVTELISEKKNSFINNEQTRLQNKNTALNKQNNFFWIITSIGIVVIAGIILFLFYKKRNNRNSPQAALKENKSNKNRNIKPIKPEVEEKILQRLNEFEKSNQYIEKSITLSALSTYCNTNAKYLSMVINRNKQKDFNNYINGLRIEYLVNKLKTEPQYLKFKIANLAELVGFSTQSKFIEAFKKEMKTTPSIYIKSLDDEYQDIT